MTVSIDKFWIEGVLTKTFPRFLKQGGVDLDGNGIIEGQESFGDLDNDGTIGDRDDFKIYLHQNRSRLSRKISFLKWGEGLSVDNRIHQAIYLKSDLHSKTQIASAYMLIADLVGKAGEELGQVCFLPPHLETQVYYATMKRLGILFKDSNNNSLVSNINKRELDCDTSSFVAMALGDERGLKLQPVRTPNHIFLRGKNGDGTEFNIDVGRITSNESYGIAPVLVQRGTYLKTLDDRQLEALFLTNRGSVLVKQGRNKEALISYNRATDIDPNNANAHNNRCVVLKKLGRIEEALISCNRAITINPNSVDFHNNRGVVLEELGRNGEALFSYNKALAIDPNDPLVHYNRSIVLKKLRGRKKP